MYHIYHTEGIILGSRNVGEADKDYKIFTRELGMITARAEGVRKLSSKLRFILQDFAYLRIDLVQGKSIFRLTSATKTNLLEDITKNKKTFKVFANIARLLRRLLMGIERNEPLFENILDGLRALENAASDEEIKNIETTLVLNILEKLGYVEQNRSALGRLEAVNLINQILKETQL